MKTKDTTISNSNVYQLDGRVPVRTAVPFGLQHILAMFVANISPILIVAGASGLSSAQSAMLIQSAMIIAGIGTLIQPIVAASVVTAIGFSLLSVGVSSFGGGSSFPYYSD